MSLWVLGISVRNVKEGGAIVSNRWPRSPSGKAAAKADHGRRIFPNEDRGLQVCEGSFAHAHTQVFSPRTLTLTPNPSPLTPNPDSHP